MYIGLSQGWAGAYVLSQQYPSPKLGAPMSFCLILKRMEVFLRRLAANYCGLNIP